MALHLATDRGRHIEMGPIARHVFKIFKRHGAKSEWKGLSEPG